MTRTEDTDRTQSQMPRILSSETVDWGFRLLGGRAPLNEREFASFQALPDIDAMRRAFTNLPEFNAFFGAVLTGRPSWAMPLFLLRPPQNPALPWRFTPPNLERPVSQFCTAAQFQEPAFLEVIQAMALQPRQSRMQWEQAWIVSLLATEQLLAPGKSGVWFGPGRERIASLLASRGVAVTGADDPRTAGSAAPPLTAKEAESRRLNAFHPEIVDIQDFDTLVRWAISPDEDAGRRLGGFDFCWSVGEAGRFGSIAAALDFIEASLSVLRPGGLALHTFALNLSSDMVTWELPDLVVLRRRDIETLAAKLAAIGHTLLPLNTHPGHDHDDEAETLAPGALRERLGFVVVTSFGLAIRKAG